MAKIRHSTNGFMGVKPVRVRGTRFGVRLMAVISATVALADSPPTSADPRTNGAATLSSYFAVSSQTRSSLTPAAPALDAAFSPNAPSGGQSVYFDTMNPLLGVRFSGQSAERHGERLDLAEFTELELRDVAQTTTSLNLSESNLNATLERQSGFAASAPVWRFGESALSFEFSKVQIDRVAIFPTAEEDSAFDYYNSNSAFSLSRDLGSTEMTGGSMRLNLFNDAVVLESHLAYSSSLALPGSGFIADKRYWAADESDQTRYAGFAQFHRAAMALGDEAEDHLNGFVEYRDIGANFVSADYGMVPNTRELAAGGAFAYGALWGDIDYSAWMNKRDLEERENLDWNLGGDVRFDSTSLSVSLGETRDFTAYGEEVYHDCYYNSEIDCDDDELWYDWSEDDWEEDYGGVTGFDVASLWEGGGYVWTDPADEEDEFLLGYEGAEAKRSLSRYLSMNGRASIGEAQLSLSFDWTQDRVTKYFEDAEESSDEDVMTGRARLNWENFSLATYYALSTGFENPDYRGDFDETNWYVDASYSLHPATLSLRYGQREDVDDWSRLDSTDIEASLTLDLEDYRQPDPFAEPGGEPAFFSPFVPSSLSASYRRSVSFGTEVYDQNAWGSWWGDGGEDSEPDYVEAIRTDRIEHTARLDADWRWSFGTTRLSLSNTRSYDALIREGEMTSNRYYASLEQTLNLDDWRFSTRLRGEHEARPYDGFIEATQVIGLSASADLSLDDISLSATVDAEELKDFGVTAEDDSVSRRLRGNLSMTLDGLLPDAFTVEGVRPTLRAGGFVEYESATPYRAGRLDYGGLLFGAFRF
jgi:hypothetical protein